MARAGALLGLDRIMALVLGQGIFSGGEMPQVRASAWKCCGRTAWPRPPPRIASRSTRSSTRNRSRPRSSPACCTTSANWCSPWACPSIRTGPRAGAAQAGQRAARSRCSSCGGAYRRRRIPRGSLGLPNTIAEAIAYHEDPSQSQPGLRPAGHRARRRPHRASPRHRRSARARTAPELSYLEKNDRGERWNEWREMCAAAIAQGSPS